jgi:hypothetical protein
LNSQVMLCLRTRIHSVLNLGATPPHKPIVELGRLLAALGLMRDQTGSFEVWLAG